MIYELILSLDGDVISACVSNVGQPGERVLRVTPALYQRIHLQPARYRVHNGLVIDKASGDTFALEIETEAQAETETETDD